MGTVLNRITNHIKRGTDSMTEKEEIHSKLNRIRTFMNENGYKGVLFRAQHNFSWLTAGGDDQIIHGTELGFVCILVTLDAVFLITNNIEMPRVSEEETEDLGKDPFWETPLRGPLHVYP